MIGWHYRLEGHEPEQAPGVGDGQGGLACCSPRGRKELGMTERRNNNSSSPLHEFYSSRAGLCQFQALLLCRTILTRYSINICWVNDTHEFQGIFVTFLRNKYNVSFYIWMQLLKVLPIKRDKYIK